MEGKQVIVSIIQLECDCVYVQLEFPLAFRLQ